MATVTYGHSNVWPHTNPCAHDLAAGVLLTRCIVQAAKQQQAANKQHEIAAREARLARVLEEKRQLHQVGLTASVPLCLSALLPRCLTASVPLCLSASLPQCLSALVPRCLNSTRCRRSCCVHTMWFHRMTWIHHTMKDQWLTQCACSVADTVCRSGGTRHCKSPHSGPKEPSPHQVHSHCTTLHHTAPHSPHCSHCTTLLTLLTLLTLKADTVLSSP